MSDRDEGTWGRAIGGLGLGAALLWGASRALGIPHALPLPPALPGERREFSGRAGRLSYYVAGQGAPLLLIHSINAAASAYEVRPIFDHFRTQRRVYALDLPGFGFSERSKREYSPRLFTDAIFDMLDEMARDGALGLPDALALSLGAEFLARAASEQPDRFRTLALITPTAFAEGDRFEGAPGSKRGVRGVRDLLEFPLWAQAGFDLLNSRPSQRYFLKKTFGAASAIDAGLLEYSYLTAHQPGARHAPYYFLSGTLFSADIHRVYGTLRHPVWLAYGPDNGFSDFGGLTRIVGGWPNWQIRRYPLGALPFFQRPDQFMADYTAFLSEHAPPIIGKGTPARIVAAPKQ